LTVVTQQAPLAVGAAAFLVCLVLGLPLAFAFGITTLILITFSPGMVLTTLPLQMVGGVNSFVLLALPFFVLTGGLLTGGGIAASLLRFLGDVTGTLRGGSAMTGVAGMYLFSGLSGAKIADVAAVAPVLAPTMRAEGYPDTELAGVLSASAAMGESVPPSLAILVLTSVTSVSTGALFLAGLAPAAAVALCILALIVVRSRALRIRRRTESPARSVVLRHFAQALLPAGMPVLIFGGIIFGVATPIEASGLAVAYGLLLSLAVYRNPVRSVVAVAASAARMSAMLLFLLAATAAFVWVITADGVAGQLASAVTVFAGNRIAFMLATIVLLIVTGAVFEGLPAIVIFAPLLLPIAVGMGIDTLQYSVVIVMAMGVGNFLPPVGIGYFATCTLVGARPDHAAKTTFTYMTAALAGIVIIALVPAITTLIPHLAGAR
jgi:tripartite ATP-independent transporter DctM subunit